MTYGYRPKDHEVSVSNYAPQDAPSWALSASLLWNKVEAFEDAIAEERFQGHPTHAEKNARSLAARAAYQESAVTAHSIIFALPKELTRAQNKQVIDRFVAAYMGPRQLCVTAGFHWEKSNPHVHLQVAPRALDGETFSPIKNRDFYSPKELRVRRHLIADTVNTLAREEGLTITIDARSYEDRGIDLVPTRHEGWFAQKYLKESSRLIQENQEIREENIQILFEKPETLLKVVMGQNSVVTRSDIEAEIFKRVGGDDQMWALMAQRLDTWLETASQHPSPILQKLAQNPALVPFLASVGIKNQGRDVPADQGFAERLYASLPTSLQNQITIEDLRAATGEGATGALFKEDQQAQTAGSSLEIHNLQGPPLPSSSRGSGTFDGNNIIDQKSDSPPLPSSSRNHDLALSSLPEVAHDNLPEEDTRSHLVTRFVDAFIQQGPLDRVGTDLNGTTVYTTQEKRALEDRTQGTIEGLATNTSFSLKAEDVRAARLQVASIEGYTLDPEQEVAVTGLTGKEGLVVLEGRAGTGKTTVLKTVKQAYEDQGYRVLGSSFQGRTAAFLEEDSGIRSHTLDLYQRRWARLDKTRETLAAVQQTASKAFIKPGRYAKAPEKEKSEPYLQKIIATLTPYDLGSRDVIVVDEAFMSPSSSLRPLLERANKAGAKVILVGDSQQSLTFTSGDLTRQVRDRVGSVPLETIRRQSQEWQREASGRLAQHDLWKGFRAYQTRGYLITCRSYSDTIQTLVKDWAGHVTDHKGQLCSDKIKETMLLAFTNKDVDQINQVAVQHLKDQGFLRDPHYVSSQKEALEEACQEAHQRIETLLSQAPASVQGTLRASLTPTMDKKPYKISHFTSNRL